MTILSGRERSCIQDTKKDKNELCNELLDPRKVHINCMQYDREIAELSNRHVYHCLQFQRCPYYNDKNKKYLSSFNALQNFGLETPWDIEDLVSLGKKVAACPYYGARSLMANAEIIFCPYNYIIDPSIRESVSTESLSQQITQSRQGRSHFFSR
jgi:Fanconi anemia group J protein